MWTETGLWADVRELPEGLAATLDASDGFSETVELLRSGGVRRVVASGNGAAYYVALALWLAAMHSPGRGPEVVAVPSGLLAGRWFAFRPGDRLLAISSSGEFRDLIEAIDSIAPQPYAAITATAGSTVERGAGARALQQVKNQRAVTHTQALAGGLVCALWIWARLSGDDSLGRAVQTAPDTAARVIAMAEGWTHELGPSRPPAAIAFSGGPGWAAALEAALLLKEISRVPCEGVESREGATSAMFGLAPGHLALSLPLGDDPGLAETERLCAGAGAEVVRVPGGAEADPRLALLTTLPGACAVSAVLALAGGHDVDRPAWTEAYESTARGPT
jgi:glucosamine 6-phosphate synthetase-like amidotransferase/phosphosugar isomerase protein